MVCKNSTLGLLLLYTVAATAQSVLPPGTPFPVQIDDHLPMRVGLPIRASLIYPVYANDILVLPEHTILTGTVTSLHPNRSRRTRALLGGDFTPFHIPVVQFTQILLPDGSVLPFSSDPATDGAPIYRAVAPPPAKGGFLRRQFDMGLSIARDNLAIFIAPGKGDRLKQFIYGELPYHPERIEKNTAWTIQTTAPLTIPPQPALPSPPVVVPRKRHFWEQPAPPPPAPDDSGKWTIQAYLDDPISSETTKAGQTIKATVAEPIYNPDHTIAIPQGATLVGAVTKAKPSRSFGRSGTLNFSFRQLTLPGGEPQNVETTLTGADSAQALALNSEGQEKPKPQDKISVPILLALMASRPLDQDHHGAGNGLGKNAVGGAAGLGLVGTIIGLAGVSPNAAAGIGYWGTAVAVYYRWIARGKKITFARDTRIVVQTIARSSAAMHPDPTRAEHP
ncbi:MAG: hypothetical protein ABI286_12805 [Edaphobacter sp.]